MSTKTIIEVKAGTKYLSEVMSELPKGCLFNKGVVGAGGTTISLTNNENTVVAVPFKELTTNKADQSLSNKMYPYEVFAVNGDVSDNQIIHYINESTVMKFIVTYDSLERLMRLINYPEFTLLVDEYHILFTDYSFRRKACDSVLNNYTKFKNFTFMTATPIEEESILEELKDLPVVTAVWEDAKSVTIKPLKAIKGVMKTTVGLINEFLSGEQEGNLYLFVNSVSFIQQVMRKVKVDDTNCRVIYSDYNTTKLKVKRGKTTDEPKKINFITSKAFEGADIYDTEGKVVVISDGFREHTLLDISTKLIQITGRIRNTRYYSEIYHITSFTRYNDNKLSYEEYKKALDKEITEEVGWVNLNSKFYKERLIKETLAGRNPFHNVLEDNTIVYDANRLKIDLYNYKVANEVYKNCINLASHYASNGVKADKFQTVDNSHLVIKNLDDVENDFQLAVETIKEMSEKGEDYLFLLMGYSEQFPYLTEALEKLGFEGIENLKYHTSNIKRKLDVMNALTSECTELGKIKTHLRHYNSFNIGVGYTGTEIKEKLQEVYNELGLTLKAKGKDIESFYITSTKSVRVDGKPVKKVFILAKKY